MVSKDLSEGDASQSDEDVSQLVEDRKQKHLHRRVAFYVGWFVVSLVTAGLLYWLFCPLPHKALIEIFKDKEVKDGLATIFITPAIILASFACLLALGLLRFAFQSNDSGRDEGETLSIWGGIAKEALSIFKAWVDKK